MELKEAVEEKLREFGLKMQAGKTKIVWGRMALEGVMMNTFSSTFVVTHLCQVKHIME